MKYSEELVAHYETNLHPVNHKIKLLFQIVKVHETQK